ncbi:hypothetical protein KDH_17570 [Dictyobacter sp. S3.2.2.5]|uniref:Uncharacterized protein n=1 Tax=Dictyobacter halimunensis TaxID=3026934 RepID=A0ABQ6FKX9_9CHLR|nr:hypothetical protein KDH_17570 [Dictyobacter sp. S3.2.2.5]
MPTCSAHRSAGFHGIFDMRRRFDHDIEHCIMRANHAKTLECTAGINPDDKKLVIGFLLIAQLDKEHAKPIALWTSMTALE